MPRWLSRQRHRALVGRLIVGLTAGIIAGVAISKQVAEDRRTWATLTKEQYLTGFDAEKEKRQHKADSLAVALFVGVTTMLLIAGLYEGGGIFLTPAVGWVDDALARRGAARRAAVLDDTDV